jgi:predicted small integral membrane protein
MGDNIKIDLGKIGFWDVDWVDLAQDRNWWRALVKSVIYSGFHKMRGIS